MQFVFLLKQKFSKISDKCLQLLRKAGIALILENGRKCPVWKKLLNLKSNTGEYRYDLSGTGAGWSNEPETHACVPL